MEVGRAMSKLRRRCQVRGLRGPLEAAIAHRLAWPSHVTGCAPSARSPRHLAAAQHESRWQECWRGTEGGSLAPNPLASDQTSLAGHSPALAGRPPRAPVSTGRRFH